MWGQNVEYLRSMCRGAYSVNAFSSHSEELIEVAFGDLKLGEVKLNLLMAFTEQGRVTVSVNRLSRTPWFWFGKHLFTYFRCASVAS